MLRITGSKQYTNTAIKLEIDRQIYRWLDRQIYREKFDTNREVKPQINLNRRHSLEAI